jgi:hypothetical protein
MHFFDLSNPYTLRTCFRIYPTLIKHLWIFQIGGCVFGSHVAITSDSVHYVIDKGSMRYDTVIYYRGKHVISVSSYCFKFCDISRVWYQTNDYHTFAFFNEDRQNVVAQVKNQFYTIDTCWDEDDDEAVENPWWYYNIKTYEQRCTPKTHRYVRLFIEKLRVQVDCNRYFKSKRLKRVFQEWKRWYFDPDNVDGYVKRLITNYDLTRNFIRSY